MKRFIALVLSLVMALSLCAPAWGAGGTGAATDPYVVSTFDEMRTAVASGGYIKLGADIGVSGDWDSTNTLYVDKTVNFDLNGYTLYGPHVNQSGNQHLYAFIVNKDGTLTLTDTSAAQTGEINCHYSGIETKGGTFVMNGGKITAADALYAVAVVNYGGTVTINDGVVNAYDTVITTQAYFATTATTKVAGGEVNLLSSNNNYVVFETGGEYNTGTASVEIAGGDVNSNGENFASYVTTSGTATMEVTGGSFDVNVSDYIAEGHAVTMQDGKYVVEEEVVTYTVTFNANGGIGTMEDVTDIAGEYTLPECKFTAPEGQQFKGWSDTATGDNIITSITVTDDITIYAIWEDNPGGNPGTTTPGTPNRRPAGGTTTEDKTVESPKTFDAGIALYVGVSVMGAIGSVALSKKRED